MRSFLFAALFLAGSGIGLAAAVAAPPEETPTAHTVTVKPGVRTFLASAVCFVKPVSSPAGTIDISSIGSFEAAYIVLPAEQRNSLKVELTHGAKADADCVAAGKMQVQVMVDSGPEISGQAVEQAFTVLMAAFVLALLLESAFELLFNWRLFQAYFVGRAWRTPIMFLASLIIVRHFKLDLLAQVFAAYHGGTVPSSSWTSSILTAMILGGGSVGVNRLLVALKFRPEVPKTMQETRRPASTEAYLSIDVQGIAPDQKVSIEMQEVDNTAGKPPTLAVVTAETRSRLKAIFFPSRTRFPASGGMTLVAGTKCYRFVVRDLESRTLYNVDGKEIERFDQATEFCFAPRSIVDLVVDLR